MVLCSLRKYRVMVLYRPAHVTSNARYQHSRKFRLEIVIAVCGYVTLASTILQIIGNASEHLSCVYRYSVDCIKFRYLRRTDSTMPRVGYQWILIITPKPEGNICKENTDELFTASG
ncbi:hypothetical protein JTB14_010101 [Gonioctena quinquepunctata]|nr:hypothetical protein JTB14_010101 [Gonioctena quinquepunctata]